MSVLTRSHFTWVLLLAYLALFHIWMRAGDEGRIASAGIGAAVLNGFLFQADRRSYFVNRWDLIFHASVIFDIIFEGIFVSVHDNFSFYYCALGFAIVLFGYRAIKRSRLESVPNSI